MAGPFRVTSLGFLGVSSGAPVVNTLSPADDATGVDPSTNLVITFDQSVDAEAGASNDIVIYKASDDSVVETIDAQAAAVTGSGTDTITVNPTSDLPNGTALYVQIGADAFDNSSSVSYAGISDKTSWSFTTASFEDTYMVVSTTFPDELDIYVDGNLAMKITDA